MTKRELLALVFANKPAERTPVGFWYHFLEDQGEDGLKNPALIEKNISGHRKFFAEFQPDMVKIMSDGFFVYPNPELAAAKTPAELRKVRPLGENHPWIEKQVEFVKTITGEFGGEVFCFYNIFAPATVYKTLRKKDGDREALMTSLMLEDPDSVRCALSAAGEDIASLAKRVILEGGADGIYFSTQNMADSRITAEIHEQVISPSDLMVLEAANEAGNANILHICGFRGHRNELSHFTGYPAQIINWAVNVEGVSLGAGKRLFGGKPVIGGFDNTAGGVLYRGSKEEVEAETVRLLREAGRTGVILGADCTIPKDIATERLNWVRDKAAR